MLVKTVNKNNIIEKLKRTVPQKTEQKRYVIIGGAILTIIILHFVLQFSFIQNENIHTIQNLTKVEAPTEDEEFTEQIVESLVVSTTETEAEVKDIPDSEAKVAPKTEFNTKTVRIIRKPKVTPAPVQSRPKTTQSQIVIKKKVPPQETRAERLRRTERILTGV